MKDSLGSRIKRYEAVSNYKLTPKTPVMIRVDGKAFHTYTKKANKPFDKFLIKAMTNAAIDVSKQMSGFKLAYVQSDEATFLLMDTDTHETQAWFNYEVNKIVSITASAMTAAFNYYIEHYKDWQGMFETELPYAMFDARAFNVPSDEWQNVFIWRQKDWIRNSVSMLGRAHYSQQELQGIESGMLKQKLRDEKGVVWEDLEPRLRYGTFYTPNGVELYSELAYKDFSPLILS